jgi:hypothetical protein
MEGVMTGTRILLLASALVVAAPGCALSAYSADPQRGPRQARVNDRWDQRDERGIRRGGARYDLAVERGSDDGYAAGLRDGQRGDRFDPIGERRYRAGDRGYDRRYGPRDLYKDRYRDAFRRAYEQGYRNGRRSDRGASRWWPFGG